MKEKRTVTIYVGSLMYRPVFKSHCFAFGRACEKEGYSVRYMLSRGYEWMLSKEEKGKTVFIGNSSNIHSMVRDTWNLENRKEIARVFSKDSPTHVYLMNYHFLNHLVAKRSEQYNALFIYHVHEPYVEDKKYHGGFHQYWLHLFEHFQGRLLDCTDIAIVSSNLASNLFESHYPNFSGTKVYVPLMLEDLSGWDNDDQERQYVTFVGPPLPAKNTEKFLEIVRYSQDNHLNYKFLMTSPFSIRERRYEQQNLTVCYTDRVNDKEFGKLIRRSIAVVAPYKRETQSSSVLVSYMYGTPVVSSNVGGLPEFVSNKETGYLLDVDAKAEEWVEGIRYIQDNFLRLSKNCKRYFVDNFAGENWDRYLGSLLVRRRNK